MGIPMPEASGLGNRLDVPDNRKAIGQKLVSGFLADGRIKGVTPQGEVYDHLISEKVSLAFLTGLREVSLRGTR